MRLLQKPRYLQGLYSLRDYAVDKFSIGIFATAILTSWSLMMIGVPSAIAKETSRNYRACAARLLLLGITAENASTACAAALRPRNLSKCVNRIQTQTQAPAQDVLGYCLQARRPEDFAACVVGISKQDRQSFDPNVLNYCGRSLLPLRFAKCVVGLRREIDFAVGQAMDTCIAGSDRLGGALVPSEFQFQPVFETQPISPQPTPVPVNPVEPSQPIIPQRN